MSRSISELVLAMELFQQYGIKFVSYSQPMDTSTSSGKLLFNLFSMIAAMEHDLISERTRLKLAYLKTKGVKLGRPNKIDYESVMALRGKKLSVRGIARQLACNPSTVSRVLQKGLAKTPRK